MTDPARAGHIGRLGAPRALASTFALAIMLGSACGNQPVGGRTGAAGSGGSPTGAAGTGTTGAAGDTGAAGTGTATGAAGDTGAAGSGTVTGAAGGGTTTGAAGSGTVTGAAGTTGAGGSGTGMGVAGTTGAAGSGVTTGAAGTTAAGDTPPWRDFMAGDTMRHNVRFSAMTADPTNAPAMDGASHPGDNQIAEVDLSKPLKKKLCVVLPGIGNGPGQGIGDWAGGQGYHVFQVAYANAVSEAANGDTSLDTPGNTRMNQFDGKGRTPANANTKPFDSIEGRVIAGLKYLAVHDPAADWGWFLNKEQTAMRWSDGCFIGYSYGASHLAVIARFVRIGLGVSVSGPQSEGHPDASWLKMPSATPVERMWAMWGSQDEPATTDNGYKSHYTVTTGLLGYLGDVVHTTVGGGNMLGTPPLMGSHRISVDGQGHTEFCAGNPPLYCNLMFALPPYDK